MKELVRKLARKAGYDIRRYAPVSSETARFHALLAYHRIDIVFDIGANTGQYARSLRDGGYRGRIVSFEPLTAPHRGLTAAAIGDPDWIVAPPVAVGDTDGYIDINVAANSVSSSILAMLDTHRACAPESAYVSTERVPIARLDRLALVYLRPGSRAFIKVDTQGYESHVVRGAVGIFPYVIGMQIELSLVPLYDGQPLLMEMVRNLDEQGYAMHALVPGLTEPDSARMIQADGIFFRRDARPFQERAL